MESLESWVGRIWWSQWVGLCEGDRYSQKQQWGGQGPGIEIMVGFTEEDFKVLGGERKERVWGKSSYSEERDMVL